MVANRYFFVYQGIFTFLAAAYPRYAVSVMAVNTTTRCLASAAFPLFTDQSKLLKSTVDEEQGDANRVLVLKKTGYQWAMTLIAFLTLALLPFPYVLFSVTLLLECTANGQEVHLLSIWKNLEREKQIRFCMSSKLLQER